MIFVYHCFDRIVINGYHSMPSQPEQIVYSFKEALGKQCIAKEVLPARTKDCTGWIKSYAQNRGIPCEWALAGVHKEDYVRPRLRKMERENRFGVYFILKSMEQGNTLRSVEPKYPTKDQNYRIVKKTCSRFTHFCFYIRDGNEGPMCIRMASFLPFPTTCYLNGHKLYFSQILEFHSSKKIMLFCLQTAPRPFRRQPTAWHGNHLRTARLSERALFSPSSTD